MVGMPGTVKGIGSGNDPVAASQEAESVGGFGT
jgi:hypothetical protein